MTKERTVSCGCCSLGCTCHIHQKWFGDKKICKYHQTYKHSMICEEFENVGVLNK